MEFFDALALRDILGYHYCLNFMRFYRDGENISVALGFQYFRLVLKALFDSLPRFYEAVYEPVGQLAAIVRRDIHKEHRIAADGVIIALREVRDGAGEEYLKQRTPEPAEICDRDIHLRRIPPKLLADELFALAERLVGVRQLSEHNRCATLCG